MMFEALALLLTRLTAMVGEGGEFEECKVALYQHTEFVPNSGMTYAQLVAGEADFGGYARSADLVWGAPFANAANEAVLMAGSVQFTSDDDVTPNVIGGYAVVDTAGTKILFAEQFAEPRVISQANHSVIIVPRYTWGRKQAA